ncbi:hypothetical protein M569_15244, partial [Genlisea aurea]
SDDIFSILEALESVVSYAPPAVEGSGGGGGGGFGFQTSTRSSSSLETETEQKESSMSKRQKVGAGDSYAPPRVSHITVERNRRKQMNDHLSVLRSLMPSLYVKK